MVNGNDNHLIYKLSRLFFRKFWMNLIILSLILIVTLITLIMAYSNYLMGTEDIIVVIMCLCIFTGTLTVTIIGMKPFIKDIKIAKAKAFKMINGKVIKYRKVIHGGDPDTISYYPTIRDINKAWVEVEVKTHDTELNKTFHCLYLPHTKLAVCEELLDKNGGQYKF